VDRCFRELFYTVIIPIQFVLIPTFHLPPVHPRHDDVMASLVTFGIIVKGSFRCLSLSIHQASPNHPPWFPHVLTILTLSQIQGALVPFSDNRHEYIETTQQTML
jgi:hypothetical protein